MVTTVTNVKNDTDAIFHLRLIDKLNKLIDGYNEYVTTETGFGAYADDQYTVSNPLILTNGDEINLPNNKLLEAKEDQLPADVTTFLDNDAIISSLNDSLIITVTFNVIPDATSFTYMNLSLDVGGSVGKIFPTTFDFTKGSATYGVTTTITGYVGEDWSLNGGFIKISANTDLQIFNISCVVHRLHRGF